MYLGNSEGHEKQEKSGENTSIMANVIDYLELFKRDVCCWRWAIKKYWILLALSPLLGAVVFFTIRTLTTSPVYMSRCSLIRQEPADARFRDYPAGVIVPPKLDAIFNIILSRQCLSETIKRLNQKWSVGQFFQMISLEQASKNSNYIFLAVKTNEPQLSAEAANTLAEVFIAHYKNFLRDYGKEPYENLERSNRELAAELENLQAELKSLAAKNNIGFLEGERNMIEQRILLAEEQNQRANTDMEIIRVKLEELEKQLKATPEKTELYSESSTAREQALAKMKVELSELLQRYTDQNPLVIRKKAMIDELAKTLLENKDDGNDKVVIGINPEYTELKIEISKLTAEYKALKSYGSQRNANLNALLTRREQLSNLAPAYNTLQDRIEQKKELLNQKEIQARELEMFRSRHFSDISIHELAVPSNSPVGRARALWALLGLLMGVLASWLYVFLREFFNLSIRTKGDLESALNIPLLGVVPTLSNELRSDFYSSLQEIIDKVDKGNKIAEDSIMVLAIIEDQAKDYNKILDEVLNMIVVKDITYLRIKEITENDCNSTLLINDFLYGLTDELPKPGKDNLLYFKLDDMAFFSPPSPERLFSIGKTSGRNLIIWELFSYKSYPQFYARVCSTAAVTILPFCFGRSSKASVSPILNFLRENGVNSFSGVIYAVDEKYYQEVKI
ncbi:MAG: hypothetical protein GX280_01115 [Lentisphaerae bacterium]|nr:hypothetical protein [Lentisphaerota bacterium]